MMTKQADYDLAILGHFAKDKLIVHGLEKDALGGAVYYGAIALAKLNVSVGIITLLAKEDFHYLNIFKANGVGIFAYQAEETSGIKNTYSDANNLNERVCEPIAFAGEFKVQQIPDITAKVFHIGPIMAGEVSLKLINYITSKFEKVSLDLQGVLRVREGKKLTFVDWPEKEDGLKRIHTVKADSVESEIITGEKELEKAARRIASWGPQEVVITHKDGILVYAEGEVFEAPFTPRTLNGRTGRGDTCISTYLASRLKSPPPISCAFAAAATSLKLEEEGPFNRTYQDVLEKLNEDY